jgi:hypothetical protein
MNFKSKKDFNEQLIKEIIAVKSESIINPKGIHQG